MLVIEGPSGSGKSSLARALSMRFGPNVHHSRGKPVGENPEQEITARQERVNQLLASRTLCLIDRTPALSDPVYGVAVRGGESPFFRNVFAMRAAKDFRFRLHENEIPLLYCRPPLSVIRRNNTTPPEKAAEGKEWKTPQDAANDAANILGIVRQYDIRVSDFAHVTYDYTQTISTLSLQDIGDLIETQIRKLNLWI